MVIAYFALTTSLRLPFIFHWAIFIQIPFQYKTFFIEFARYGEGAPSMEQPSDDSGAGEEQRQIATVVVVMDTALLGCRCMRACRKNDLQTSFFRRNGCRAVRWNHKSHIKTNWVNWILRGVLPTAHFAATVILQVLDNLLLKMWPRCCTAEAVDWAHCLCACVDKLRLDAIVAEMETRARNAFAVVVVVVGFGFGYLRAHLIFARISTKLMARPVPTTFPAGQRWCRTSNPFRFVPCHMFSVCLCLANVCLLKVYHSVRAVSSQQHAEMCER